MTKLHLRSTPNVPIFVASVSPHPEQKRGCEDHGGSSWFCDGAHGRMNILNDSEYLPIKTSRWSNQSYWKVCQQWYHWNLGMMYSFEKYLPGAFILLNHIHRWSILLVVLISVCLWNRWEPNPIFDITNQKLLCAHKTQKWKVSWRQLHTLDQHWREISKH